VVGNVTNWIVFWITVIAGCIGIIFLFWQIDCYAIKKRERPESTKVKRK
jgi:hypothetical protein